MSFMSKEAIVSKREAGGWVLVPLPRQGEMVREFERSGLSGPKSATLAGVTIRPSLLGVASIGLGPR